MEKNVRQPTKPVHQKETSLVYFLGLTHGPKRNMKAVLPLMGMSMEFGALQK